MKRTVLAIAVGAALATAGVAQAEVKIFGKAHVSVDSIDAKDPADATKNKSSMYVSSNSSSLGFSAEEDMGNGMKAGLKVDTGITVDASKTANIWDRETFAYLGGGFGNVSVGKIESPMKMLGRKVDFFGDQVGDSRNLIADKVGCCGFDNRPGNAIQYTTPDMGGLMAQFLYTPEESVKDGSSMTLRVDFGQGPMFVGAAYETRGQGMNTAVGADEDESAIRVAGSFAMGDAKVAGLVQMATNIGGFDGADRTTYGLGGSFKLSAAGTVKAQVYMADEKDGTGNADTEGTLFALGYDHAMSKNTTVYAAFASTTNGDAAAFTATGGGHGSEQTTATAIGEVSTGISFGLIHKI